MKKNILLGAGILLVLIATTNSKIFAATSSYTWDLLNDSNYTISDELQAEVEDSLARLKSDPSSVNLSIYSHIHTESQDLEISRNEQYAYLTNEDGELMVFDISDPSNPTEVMTIDDTADTALNEAYNLLVYDNYLYVTSSEGLEVLDLSDPSNPTHTAALFDDSSTILRGNVAITRENHYLYILGENGLGIVNIANPTEPQYLGGIIDDASLLLALTRSIDIENNLAYITGSEGLQILDVSDPTNITSVGQIAHSYYFHSVRHAEHYIYVTGSSSDGGFFVFDVSDPTTPTRVNNNNLFSSNTTTMELDGNVVIVHAGNDIMIVDITNPTDPTIIRTIDEPFADHMTLSENNKYLLIGRPDEAETKVLNIEKTYYQTTPFVQPTSPQHFEGVIDSFIDELGSNNEGQVVYQVSIDGGTTWKYWNGSTWVTTTATDGSETSTANDINAHVESLTTDGGDLTWRAYLISNGNEQVELDSVTVTFSDAPTPTSDNTEDTAIGKERPQNEATGSINQVNLSEAESSSSTVVQVDETSTDSYSEVKYSTNQKAQTNKDNPTKEKSSIAIYLLGLAGLVGTVALLFI